MCGIFGITDCENTSTPEIAETLATALDSMEYRGYDSVGMCVLNKEEVLYVKAKGRVSQLREKINNTVIKNETVSKEKINDNTVDKPTNNITLGIAHTRWATHGKASEKNAHPIISDSEQTFFVVHNGIISNYLSLKRMLLEKGYSFETETDTEVIAKLALQFYRMNSCSLEEIARDTAIMCEGAFSFIIISKAYPNQMVAVRSGAPLILGVGNDAEIINTDNINAEIITDDFNADNITYNINADDNITDDNINTHNVNINTQIIKNQKRIFISSDVIAIINHTNKVVNLNDGDIVVINKDEIRFKTLYSNNNDINNINNNINNNDIINNNINIISHSISTLSTDYNSAFKGNHSHFMIKEIFEQQESIVNSMRGRIVFEKNEVYFDQFSNLKSELINAQKFIFIACGTSYHSCLANRKLFEELTGKTVSIEIASNFLDMTPVISKNDVCFFISQSGETADSLLALNYCKKFGALCIGITNIESSTIASSCPNISINAGIEKSVASTKAYTSQFVCIVLIGIYISQIKKTNEKRRSEIIQELQIIQKKVKDTLSKSVEKFVLNLQKSENLILISRGFQSAICLEGALKIKETTYLHAEGIYAGELKHGPLALVNPKMNIIIIIANDEFYPKTHSAFQQVQARGASPMVICTEDLADHYENCIAIPKTIDCLQGLLTVIPLQMISFQLALEKGIDPDFPRNLAKSVTVE